MSDTDTDSLSHPRRSDSESEWHGKLSIKPTICIRGSNVSPNSVDLEQFESSTKLGNSLPTRSTHTPSNWVGSVHLEEAESCKGERFLASPTLTHPQRDTPPTLSGSVAGPWVEGGDSRGWARISIHNHSLTKTFKPSCGKTVRYSGGLMRKRLECFMLD